MRKRGVADVRIADLRDIPMDGDWNTILLMGGNPGDRWRLGTDPFLARASGERHSARGCADR